MSDDDGEKLVQFHKTISEQLNARLAESPRFFGVLVLTSTAYGYVLWNYHGEREKTAVFLLASSVAYTAVLWALWYLAALGYAFRYLQNAQHRIEDDLGLDRYRSETTGIPPERIRRLSDLFWLLPGIYHAHAFGLSVFLFIVLGALWWNLPDRRTASIVTAVAAMLALVAIFACNWHYLQKYRTSRVPGRNERREGGRGTGGLTMSTNPVGVDGAKILVEEWKTVIETQMHFNDMIIRTRTIGVSVVMGVYGAAALALGQYPEKFLKIGEGHVHVSAPIIGFGLLLLASIFVLDYFYYYRLLIGAVRRGEEIDGMYHGQVVDGAQLFGMTTLISIEVPRARAVTIVLVFYGFPAAAGVLSLIYLLVSYQA